MFRRMVCAVALGLGAAGIGGALAQTPSHDAASGDVTVDIQGDNSDWWSNPYNYAFYGVALAAFANGPDKVDEAALEKAFMQVARDFALEMGLDPAMMQDHLKLIPGQLIEIIREDPGVLDNYQNLMAALRGPA